MLEAATFGATSQAGMLSPNVTVMQRCSPCGPFSARMALTSISRRGRWRGQSSRRKASLSRGQFVALPALHPTYDAPTKVISVDTEPDVAFDPGDRDLLAAHAKFGCRSAWCVMAERAHPFVFLPRMFKRRMPGAQLIYCPEVREDFPSRYLPFISGIGLLASLLTRNSPRAARYLPIGLAKRTTSVSRGVRSPSPAGTGATGTLPSVCRRGRRLVDTSVP
jgi:hypothetical protein